MQELLSAFSRLRRYCEREGFRGWDPYDGLNSRVFQALPLLKRSALCRLVVIQGFKRCPVNLRRVALVPKEHNAKGIGLFLGGYCNLLRTVQRRPELAAELGTAEALTRRIDELAQLLLSLRSPGYAGSCWGYNFDWQARRLFLFPKGTPTVVATCFCASALLEAYDLTRREAYREAAVSAARFVLDDLHRSPAPGGFLFSYSPLPGNDTVYNASLLGSKLLALCHSHGAADECLAAARSSVEACCKGQAADGSWVYGLLPVQGWIDSFHTGYNLDALATYEAATGDRSHHDAIERGFRFYVDHFFEPDGCPKYYHDRRWPIDIHCPGQLFVTLSRLGRFEEHADLARRVLGWTLAHMQSPHGYFYYQLKPGISSKIPYMRWSNAFMFNALSHYILSLCKTKE